MIVTFCGHGKIYYDNDVCDELYNVIEDLIINGANEFLLGGYGNFDLLSAKTVKKLKSKYKNIASTIVIPYIDRKYNIDLYDSSVFPPIENVPKRFAILARNKWMVDRADVVVGYVQFSFGGAYQTLKYAEKRGKKIINICHKIYS